MKIDPAKLKMDDHFRNEQLRIMTNEEVMKEVRSAIRNEAHLKALNTGVPIIEEGKFYETKLYNTTHI